MTTDLTLPCCRCGRPASLGPHGEGEHHQRDDGTPKGMGGTVVEPAQYALCRECHDALHAKRFRLLVNGDFVSTVSPEGKVQSERALVVNNQAEDTRYWADEYLVMWAAQALERMADMAWEVVRCAYEFRRRYFYREDWAHRLAELIRDHTGLTRGYSARQLYDWAKQYPAFKDNPDDWRLLQGRLSRAVSEDENPQEAMAAATVARLEGKPVALIEESLRTRQGKEPPEWCVCVCGNRHRKKEAT